MGVSNQLQLFAKEQERNKLLCSSEPQSSNAASPAPSTSRSIAKENNKTPTAKKNAGGGTKDVEEAMMMCGDGKVEDEESDTEGGKVGIKSGAKRDTTVKKKTKEAQDESPIIQTTPAEC